MTSLPKIIRILPQQITFESPFLDSLNTHIVDACQEGNLPLLKSLLSPMREDAIVSPYILSTKERLTTTDYCFVDACKIGHLEMVKYLLVDVATTGYPRARIETEQYQGFIYACLYGHLDVVQYLLTAKELTNNNIPFADMSTRNYIGLQYACTNQHFSIIKYLTTSQELQEAGHKLADIHVGNDHIFTSNASLGYMDIINYLVFDYGIDKTPAIEDFLVLQPQLQKLFAQRDLNNSLIENLQQANKKTAKNKI